MRILKRYDAIVNGRLLWGFSLGKPKIELEKYAVCFENQSDLEVLEAFDMNGNFVGKVVVGKDETMLFA